MNVYRICTKKENQNGKKNWPEIGVLFENEQGQLSGYLNNNPNQPIYLFKQEPKQSGNQGQSTVNNGHDNAFNNAPNGVQFSNNETNIFNENEPF
jgi:hypothetical protein